MPKVPRVVVLSTLCLLIVTSGATLAVGAVQEEGDQETIRTVEDSTNYLSPEEETTNQYQEVSLDVASAVDTSAQELQTEHDIRSFTRELMFVDGVERRSSVGQERLEVIEQRYLALDQRKQALFNRAYRVKVQVGVVDQQVIVSRVPVHHSHPLTAELAEVADKTPVITNRKSNGDGQIGPGEQKCLFRARCP